VALSNRGWTRQAPTRSSVAQVRVRTPHASRVITPGRVLFLLALLALAVLVLPRHITIGGHHLHPGFAPYLVPYLFG
jgi:hypothetical protein